ncbi:MarR family winged helix-turn-helix transcriptional regulator [Pseudooceanicola sp.]|uniref:MarR family winged helix-turn-helix transcriptional regulator n=1 Tax=Pseudooceanicola sp. TaxID=1914328 RepID=UPI00405A065A
MAETSSDRPSAGARDRAPDRRLRRLAGYALRLAYHRFKDEASQVLEGFGLRPRTFSALAIICDTPGLRQTQLAEVLHMERSNTVTLVDALERAGLVERRHVPEDRRSYALRATAEGRRICDAATAALEAQEDAALAAWSAGDRAALMRLLAKVDAG